MFGFFSPNFNPFSNKNDFKKYRLLFKIKGTKQRDIKNFSKSRLLGSIPDLFLLLVLVEEKRDWK